MEPPAWWSGACVANNGVLLKQLEDAMSKVLELVKQDIDDTRGDIAALKSKLAAKFKELEQGNKAADAEWRTPAGLQPDSNFLDRDIEVEARACCKFREDVCHSMQRPSNETLRIEESVALTEIPREVSASWKTIGRRAGLVAKISQASEMKRLVLNNAVFDQAASCVFDGNHVLISLFNLLCVSCILLGAWLDTLEISGKWGADGFGTFGQVFEMAVLVIFTLEILVSFNTRFENDRGQVVIDRCSIAKRYLRTWFALDIFCVIPWTMILESTHISGGNRFLKFAKLGRLARMGRLVKLFQRNLYMDMLRDFVDHAVASLMPEQLIESALVLARFVAAVLKVCLILLLEAHFVACVLISHADGGRMEPLAPWVQYFVAMRWSIAAFAVGTTVDSVVQLDFTSINFQVLQTVIILCHVGNLMCALAIFFNMKGSDDMDGRMRLQSMAIFLRRKQHISSFTRRLTMSFFRTQAKKKQNLIWNSMIKELPIDLHRQLTKDLYVRTIGKFRLFAQAPFQGTPDNDFLAIDLCTLVESRFYGRHEVVIAKGSPFDGMWWVHQGGLVRTSVTREEACTLMNEGSSYDASECFQEEFVGAESLLAPDTPMWQLASYSAITISSSEILVLTRHQFDKAIAGNPTWSFYIQCIRNAVSDKEVRISKLRQGLPPDLASQIQDSLQKKLYLTQCELKSEDLGISAEYLLQVFMGDVEESIEKVQEVDQAKATNAGDLTFAELGRVIWSESHLGFRGSASHICPRDGFTGSSIVDALEDRFKGRASHFVSWCWTYSIKTVVSALGLWAAEHESKVSEVFFWMCFFCNNQRRLLIQQDVAEGLANTFCTRLKNIGHMIIVLDDFKTPCYTSRVWCIYESYQATVNQIPIEVALPGASQTDFHKQLENGKFREIADSLASIDVELSEASFEHDERQIKREIRNSIGFTAVNQTVQCALTRWLAFAFEACLKEAVREDGSKLKASL